MDHVHLNYVGMKDFLNVRCIGFTPCKVKSVIWLRKKRKVHQYVEIHINDFVIAMKEPGPI